MNTRQDNDDNPRRSRPIIYAVAVTCAIILTVAIARFYPSQPTQPKAAIIDEVSSSQLSTISRNVNQSFVDAAKALLYERFSSVDYYSDNATVDNYARLPSLGYRLIVWRVHSALNNDSKYIAISTSEPSYTKEYPQYANGELDLAEIQGDPKKYYAITPKFITDIIGGRFEDTVIVLATCNGLKTGYEKTAEAFVSKGAKVVISWDDWVDWSDSDYGTDLLLQHLITENNTISEAVGKIPSYSSEWGIARLDYYPGGNPAVATYRIPDYRQNSNSNSATFVEVSYSRKFSM